jgi:hypothetical protein
MLKTYTYELNTGTTKKGKPVIIRAKVDAEDEEDALDKIHKEIKTTQEAVKVCVQRISTQMKAI